MKKYIKVKTSERLPDKEGEYFCKTFSKNKYRIFFNPSINAFIEHWENDVEYWLLEVPEYEEEMREMLEKVCTELYRTDNALATEVKTLLNKLKYK